MSTHNSIAAEVLQCKKDSHSWMESNFYGEMEQAWKSYKCERDPEKDDDGNVDETQTSVGMPSTFALARRGVARLTAQAPKIGYHAKDKDMAEMIGHTLMYQWDKSGAQREQKRHALQAFLLGISIKAWHWSVEDYTRRKRIDPLANPNPETLRLIAQQYGFPEILLRTPALGPVILANLIQKHGRSGKLPIEYLYTAYQGPKSDFLFIGDCYPEPNFMSLQTAGYFIVERRRKAEWFRNVAQNIPEFADGINEMLSAKPQGSAKQYFGGDRDSQTLRQMFLSAIDKNEDNSFGTSERTFGHEWTVTEMWIPGRTPKLRYVGEDNFFLGEIESPYDLDGKIPFTDLVLIDDLLSGVGDSTPRIMRGLQLIHDRQVNVRTNLVDNISRPLVGTTNNELYENPNLLKRGKGMRLVKMRSQGDMWVQGEQAAMAAVAINLQDESSIMRLWQVGTGESNMSQAANIDPQQNRTATGARLTAYNTDILTKDLTDMFTQTGLKADAEMMYLLNRSEMADAVEFDASRYDRRYTPETEMRERWVQAEAEMFQLDGEILVESGSTLADDDESNVGQAKELFAIFNGNPLVRQDKLRDTVLIALGKGKEISAWAAPPPQPPPPETKTSATVSIKWEFLSEEQQIFFAERFGMPPPAEQGPPMTPGAPGMEQMPGNGDMGAQALAAAMGNSPFPNEVPQ